MNTPLAATPPAGTSVYDTRQPALRLLRAGVGLTQRLWPWLAVRVAQRLFSTPIPPRWLQPRPPSWGTQWRTETWPFENASLTVYSPTGEPAGPVVLLVHGWGGDAGHMRLLADTIAQRGLHPVVLEMPAHGRSRGAVSHLPQFARAIGYAGARIAQQGHLLRAVVAHSLGGNAAAYAAAQGLAAQRLVLLAPPASPIEFTHLFSRVFGLSEATRLGLQQRLEAQEGILMRDFEPDSVGRRIDVPVLVVHDRDDRINRFADGEAFAKAAARGELLATTGLGHRRILKDPAVLERVVGFVARA